MVLLQPPFPQSCPAPTTQVIRAVQSLPAKALSANRQSSTANFPKEPTFQHFFNEALCRNLPRENSVISERSVEGNSLDFYINGDAGWGIKLLRLGTTANAKEHRARFGQNGKYGKLMIPLHQWLVVNCLDGSEEADPKRENDLCTLQFSENFSQCNCFMRFAEMKVLSLTPGGKDPRPSSVALQGFIPQKEETAMGD